MEIYFVLRLDIRGIFFATGLDIHVSKNAIAAVIGGVCRIGGDIMLCNKQQ
jgi:hypothetical protein